MHLSRVTVRGFRASAQRELECRFPGRFSVLIGANSAGKTTVSEGLYLAHPRAFPSLGGRFSGALLGHGNRAVDVEYSYARDPAGEGALGRELAASSGSAHPGGIAALWRRELYRDLGNVRTRSPMGTSPPDGVRLIYLPAWRNPLDDLARREARILIELLRAQQQRINGTRNLAGLRARASGLLEALASDGIITAIEDRIAAHLQSLSAGVSRQWPYVRAQVIDDAYLARVLELMLATLEGRDHAQPLEVTGLGYVNLLHIAVTLSAIPDPAAAPAAPAGAPTDGVTGPTPAPSDEPPWDADQLADGDDVNRARDTLEQARADAEMEEDSFFPSEPFHATVIIEEPEAHLHPQLQFALVRYLRQVVRDRPEIQIVLSSHANDIISACHPDELVVLRRRGEDRICLPIAELGVSPATKRKARLHMDASRSSALFAERLLLVEGVTEVAVIRQFGYLWAGADANKRSFVDALTIVPMGTKVGEWAPELLASPGKELCTKLAVLRDSDKEFSDTPTDPTWAAKYDPDIMRVFHSHPTLEPAVTPGNEPLITAVLARMDLVATSPPVTDVQVHELFRSRKAGTDTQPAIPAGPGQPRKGEFALELADELQQASRTDPSDVDLYEFVNGYRPPVAPPHIVALLDFLYPEPTGSSGPGSSGDVDTEQAEGSPVENQ